MLAADFNGNGYLDLAVPTYDDNLGYDYLEVLLGNGFAAIPYAAQTDVSGYPIATGDFNNNGILDLALADPRNPNSLVILLGNGDGTFSVPASQPSFTGANSATTGDFNGDGILDLAIAGGSNGFAILMGNGAGSFTPVSGEPVLSQGGDFIAAADLNGDGILDLVVSSAQNTISVLLGKGDGTFTLGYSQAMNYAPNGIGIADFNNDGLLDIAVANSSNNTVSIMLQTAAHSGPVVSLASSQNPTPVDQPLTYTALVFSNKTAPTGSVTFKQGSTILGTAPLLNGMATLGTSFSKGGTFPIVAVYSGDNNYPKKNSLSLKQVVQKNATAAYAFSDVNPSTFGQPVTITCDVYNTSDYSTVSSGSVTFKNGGFILGTVPLSNGQASIPASGLSRGKHIIIAIYNGDSGDSKTKANFTQVVQ